MVRVRGGVESQGVRDGTLGQGVGSVIADRLREAGGDGREVMGADLFQDGGGGCQEEYNVRTSWRSAQARTAAVERRDQEAMSRSEVR